MPANSLYLATPTARRHPLFFLLGGLAFGLLWVNVALAAEWQFAIETGRQNGRAFLWIPPTCERVRGIVIGQQVVLEKVVFEDPAIREAATRENLALVLLIPAAIGEYDDHDHGAETLQRILDGLAARSGYAELAQAPLLTLGHSGGALFAWKTAYWNPDRCFGVIGLKSAPVPPPPYARKSKSDGIPALNDVPVLDVSGQYEAWGLPGRSAEYHWRWVRGALLANRAIGNNALMSELVEPGVTHFGWSPELARYVALFIEKAAHLRIPASAPEIGQPVTLNALRQESGWLTDPTFLTPPRYPAAPFGKFIGDPTLALWHLDEEMARANEDFGAAHKGKSPQMLTFVQDGQPVPTAWMEELRFEPVGDGLTVKVAADFLRESPPELSFPEKRALSHAEGPIQFRLIGGWSGGGEQTGPDTFRIQMDRFQFVRPNGSLMILAWHPGDARHAQTEQAGQIKYPVKNLAGPTQQINFDPVPDQTPDAPPILLRATSDAGLPVAFFVLAGPAEIEGKTLKLNALPPRTKRPVEVSVVAWQWGRSGAAPVQTAEPVVRIFVLR